MPTFERVQTSTNPATLRRIIWSVNGVVESDGTSSDPVTSEVDVISKAWVRTPNFWQLRRNGSVLPENNFSYQRTVKLGPRFIYEWYTYSPSGRVYRRVEVPGAWWNATPDHGFELTSFGIYSRLIQQARSSNFSIPVTVVEAGRTVQMVREVAGTLAGTIYDLRRGRLSSALARIGLTPTRSQRGRYDRNYGKNPAEAAANAWLQYQYGWKPLLNDVKNGAEALAEAVARNGDSMTRKVYSSDRVTHGRVWPNYVIGVSPHTTGTVTAQVRLSRRAVWKFKPNSADLPGLFGLTNPMEVVWEIIPFSFVADWFLPIGNYLSALDAPLRFDHVGGHEGYRDFTEWVTEPTSVGYLDGSQFQTGGQTSSTWRVLVSRTKLIGAPTPNLADMRFQMGINATRATSAIALLYQQASRLGR
jgi:hypothetical protein